MLCSKHMRESYLHVGGEAYMLEIIGDLGQVGRLPYAINPQKDNRKNSALSAGLQTEAQDIHRSEGMPTAPPYATTALPRLRSPATF